MRLPCRGRQETQNLPHLRYHRSPGKEGGGIRGDPGRPPLMPEGSLAAVAADGAGVRLVAGKTVRAGQRGVSATPRARGSTSDGDLEIGIVQAQQGFPVQVKLLGISLHHRSPWLSLSGSGAYRRSLSTLARRTAAVKVR